jgi:histone deacetylase 1/2
LENLKQVTFAPSVQMSEIPEASMGMTDEEEAKVNDVDEDQNKDVRTTQHRKDKMVVDSGGYVSNSDCEDDGQLKSPLAKRRKMAAF